jgi:signal recognition particle subunit SRP54
MFDNLSQRLQASLKRLRGQGRLTEENMAETLREVRMSLLEADVALPVVKDFVERIRREAAGREVHRSLTPGQALVKIVYDELVRLMGEKNERLALAVRPPAVILLAGLQGAGKTTTAAKLAHFLQTREDRSVLLASTDVYRPAAIEQLARLAEQVGAGFFPSRPDQPPLAIARAALEEARRRQSGVLIVDSAGRLHVDEDMMQEIAALYSVLAPAETLFVVDATAGQDAVNAARAFHERLPLTGVVLTKADGDARGGAALSVRAVTGAPIKFLGVGESPQALEPFHPERIASRILGMGDVLTLVEEVTRVADRERTERLARKLAKGKGFDLEDFREQLLQMQRMGGVASLMEKLPGLAAVPEAVKAQVDDRQLRRLVGIIDAMTPEERRRPEIIRASRKRRIAAGAGLSVQDVNRLLRQFDEIQRMMKRFGQGGLARLIEGAKGRLPGPWGP